MNTEVPKTAYTQPRALTIGLALDVSGSMKSSISNERGGDLARLEGIQSAMDTLLEEAARLSAVLPAGTRETSIAVFVYAFGLQLPSGGDVCDLLRLADIISGSEALGAQLAQDYERRLLQNERTVAIEIMGSGARSLLSMSRGQAEAVLRDHIKARIAREMVSRQLSDPAQRLDQDLTMSIRELADKWAGFRGSLSTSNELLGGGTPMCKCLSMIYERFKREQARQSRPSRFVLFIVSDGEASDGDPQSRAQEIQHLGVEIVSCFVAPSDVTGSKRLYNQRQRGWSKGAGAMFDIASHVSADSPELQFLLGRGWRVGEAPRLLIPSIVRWVRSLSRTDSAAKLFAQVNHSQHLEEFMQVVLAPIRLEQAS